jgi:hypothetical protein
MDGMRRPHERALKAEGLPKASPLGTGTATGKTGLLGRFFMFCRNCGKEIVGEAKFCPYCGIQVEDSAQSQAKVATASPDDLLQFMNPLDGSTYKANIDPQRLVELNETCKNDREYEAWIDNLDGIDGTLRKIFKKLVKFTVTAGKIVFKMGKIVLNIVIKLVREFSHTIAGAIAGFVLGSIFSAIPLIGWALGPIVIPLLTVIGGVAGFMEDMSRRMNNAHLESRIRSNIMRDFSALGLNF